MNRPKGLERQISASSPDNNQNKGSSSSRLSEKINRSRKLRSMREGAGGGSVTTTTTGTSNHTQQSSSPPSVSQSHHRGRPASTSTVVPSNGTTARNCSSISSKPTHRQSLLDKRRRVLQRRAASVSPREGVAVTDSASSEQEDDKCHHGEVIYKQQPENPTASSRKFISASGKTKAKVSTSLQEMALAKIIKKEDPPAMMCRDDVYYGKKNNNKGKTPAAPTTSSPRTSRKQAQQQRQHNGRLFGSTPSSRKDEPQTQRQDEDTTSHSKHHHRRSNSHASPPTSPKANCRSSRGHRRHSPFTSPRTNNNISCTSTDDLVVSPTVSSLTRASSSVKTQPVRSRTPASCFGVGSASSSHDDSDNDKDVIHQPAKPGPAARVKDYRNNASSSRTSTRLSRKSAVIYSHTPTLVDQGSSEMEDSVTEDPSLVLPYSVTASLSEMNTLDDNTSNHSNHNVGRDDTHHHPMRSLIPPPPASSKTPSTGPASPPSTVSLPKGVDMTSPSRTAEPLVTSYATMSLTKTETTKTGNKVANSPFRRMSLENQPMRSPAAPTSSATPGCSSLLPPPHPLASTTPASPFSPIPKTAHHTTGKLARPVSPLPSHQQPPLAGASSHAVHRRWSLGSKSLHAPSLKQETVSVVQDAPKEETQRPGVETTVRHGVAEQTPCGEVRRTSHSTRESETTNRYVQRYEEQKPPHDEANVLELARRRLQTANKAESKEVAVSLKKEAKHAVVVMPESMPGFKPLTESAFFPVKTPVASPEEPPPEPIASEESFPEPDVVSPIVASKATIETPQKVSVSDIKARFNCPRYSGTPLRLRSSSPVVLAESSTLRSSSPVALADSSALRSSTPAMVDRSKPVEAEGELAMPDPISSETAAKEPVLSDAPMSPALMAPHSPAPLRSGSWTTTRRKSTGPQHFVGGSNLESTTTTVLVNPNSKNAEEKPATQIRKTQEVVVSRSPSWSSNAIDAPKSPVPLRSGSWTTTRRKSAGPQHFNVLNSPEQTRSLEGALEDASKQGRLIMPAIDARRSPTPTRSHVPGMRHSLGSILGASDLAGISPKPEGLNSSIPSPRRSPMPPMAHVGRFNTASPVPMDPTSTTRPDLLRTPPTKRKMIVPKPINKQPFDEPAQEVPVEGIPGAVIETPAKVNVANMAGKFNQPVNSGRPITPANVVLRSPSPIRMQSLSSVQRHAPVEIRSASPVQIRAPSPPVRMSSPAPSLWQAVSPGKNNVAAPTHATESTVAPAWTKRSATAACAQYEAPTTGLGMATKDLARQEKPAGNKKLQSSLARFFAAAPAPSPEQKTSDCPQSRRRCALIEPNGRIFQSTPDGAHPPGRRPSSAIGNEEHLSYEDPNTTVASMPSSADSMDVSSKGSMENDDIKPMPLQSPSQAQRMSSRGAFRSIASTEFVSDPKGIPKTQSLALENPVPLKSRHVAPSSSASGAVLPSTSVFADPKTSTTLVPQPRTVASLHHITTASVSPIAQDTTTQGAGPTSCVGRSPSKLLPPSRGASPSPSARSRGEKPWQKDMNTLSPNSWGRQSGDDDLEKLVQHLNRPFNFASTKNDFAASSQASTPMVQNLSPAVVAKAMASTIVGHESFTEENKGNSEDVMASNSLTRLAADSNYAVDYDQAVAGLARDHDSSSSEGGEHSSTTSGAIPRELPTEFAHHGNPKALPQNSASASPNEGNGTSPSIIFGDPDTYGAAGGEAEAAPPRVADRAKAIAQWKGGLGVKPKSKRNDLKDLLRVANEKAVQEKVFGTPACERGASSTAFSMLSMSSEMSPSTNSSGSKNSKQSNRRGASAVLSFWASSNKDELEDAENWKDRDPDVAEYASEVDPTHDKLASNASRMLCKMSANNDPSVSQDYRDGSNSRESSPARISCSPSKMELDPFSFDTVAALNKVATPHHDTISANAFDPFWSEAGDAVNFGEDGFFAPSSSSSPSSDFPTSSFPKFGTQPSAKAQALESELNALAPSYDSSEHERGSCVGVGSYDYRQQLGAPDRKQPLASRVDPDSGIWSFDHGIDFSLAEYDTDQLEI